jgi:hypothetical protein
MLKIWIKPEIWQPCCGDLATLFSDKSENGPIRLVILENMVIVSKIMLLSRFKPKLCRKRLKCDKNINLAAL